MFSLFAAMMFALLLAELTQTVLHTNGSSVLAYVALLRLERFLSSFC
jgi:hypothetical protein